VPTLPSFLIRRVGDMVKCFVIIETMGKKILGIIGSIIQLLVIYAARLFLFQHLANLRRKIINGERFLQEIYPFIQYTMKSYNISRVTGSEKTF